MNYDEIVKEIHLLEQHLLVFEYKYGRSSATFFASYQNGEEPDDNAWVLDWAEWAGTYKILQRRIEQIGKITPFLSTDKEFP